MTDQRDFKRRVRERIAKTSESYTAARKQLLEGRAPAFDVVDPIDLTEAGAALGFKCDIKMFPALAKTVRPAAALGKLRDALLGTEDDPGTRAMRAAAFRGEAQPGKNWHQIEATGDLRQFVMRAKAGVGGVSPDGSIIALTIDDEMVLCVLLRYSFPRDSPGRPLIWLHSIHESIGTLRIAGLILR